MKKYKLRRKIFTGLSLFALVLVVCISCVLSKLYWEEKREEYRVKAFSYTRTAAGYIDGDRVLSYVETGEKDAYYQQILDFLNVMQRQCELKYIYVFVPCENDYVYVWDADKIEGTCVLGDHEEYVEGGKEIVAEVFRPDPAENISIIHSKAYGYIASAYSPVFNSRGEPVAMVGVDLSMPGIEKDVLRFALIIILCVVLITIVAFAGFSALVNYNIIMPILELSNAAKSMVNHLQQDETFQVSIKTGDEIEELAGTFMQMDREVREYIRQLSAVTAEKERIGAELDVARHIQASMLPSIFPPFPERSEFAIYAMSAPAKEVGGDFYDFFLVDEGHLALVIADVSGKGVPAALFMMISKTLIKSAAQTGLSPKAVLEKVNNQLCENNEAEMFVTVWLGILEIATGKMVCANAGHEYPALRKAGGGYELFKDKHGFVVAGMENVRYQEYCLELAPGDSIYVYTDGVVEATNGRNQLYGDKRMIDTLNHHRDASCEELLHSMKEDIDLFVGEAPQFDDITMLYLEYKGQEK